MKQIELNIPQIPFQTREAVNTLRANIQMSAYSVKTVAITSALIHEGKTSLAFLLANSFAALGKRTLYVDCDIRNSNFMSRYGMAQKLTGLSELLTGQAELEDVIYEVTNVQNLHLLPTCTYAPNPSELFSSDYFGNVLKKLKEVYDFIILDTPPINAVVDGVIIAKEADGTVLVVESERTDKRECIKAVKQLEYSNIKVLGTVLNKVDISSPYKRYGRYVRYGRYGKYGYGEKKKKG